MKPTITLSLLVLTATPIGACSAQPPPSTRADPAATETVAGAPQTERARAQAFVDARYTQPDVRHSFRSKLGDTIDCIDFFAQPGVKALAARGTPITELPPPARRPSRAAGSLGSTGVAFDGTPDEEGNERRCPDTTVPRVRKSADDIVRAGGLDVYLAHQRKAPPPRRGRADAPMLTAPDYAHATTSYAGASTTFVGDSAVLSVWAPAVPPIDLDHSLAQTWTSTGTRLFIDSPPCSSDCIQSVEVGWTVDPSLNTVVGNSVDLNPHLFVYSTSDGYKSGCYNGESGDGCLAWVGLPGAAFAPGMTLPASAATTPPTVVELDVFVLSCSATGDCPGGWEVRVGESSSAVYEIGYYPASNYTGTFQSSASSFQVGGEVRDDFDYDPATKTYSFQVPMGSGSLSSAGYGNAAYATEYAVYPNSATWEADVTFDTPTATAPQYGVTPGTVPEYPWTPNNYFYYGWLCPKTSCAARGVSCGVIPDGCGGALSCGTCASGETCNSGQCTVCIPATCNSAANRECGAVDDGCGGTIDCGSCYGGQTCQNGSCIGGGGTFCQQCLATGGICTVHGNKQVCIHE
jgi:hypothetical protein